MPLKNSISGDLNICKLQAFLTILVFVLKGWDGGGGHGQGEEANERLHGVVQGPEEDIRYCYCVVRIVYGASLTV
jgi:hypothetical protein